MTEIKYYVGTFGPFIFDDDPIDDPDGDFVGQIHRALVTNGQLLVEEAPTLPGHVVRMADVGTIASQRYVEAQFVMAVSGLSVATNVNSKYIAIGNNVTLLINAVSGTSNVNTFSMTTIPAGFRPSITIHFPIIAQDNGVFSIVNMLVNAAGLVTFQKTPGVNTSWTASGTKGIVGTAVTYPLGVP